MEDEVSGNIVVELRKRGTFGCFGEDRMHLLLEVMCNKVYYALKCSSKATGQL